MVNVTYLLRVNIDIFNDAHLRRDSKLASIPNKRDKIHLKDIELTIKEVTYCDDSPGIVIELETILLKESSEKSLKGFCRKYGFEELHTD
jgi:hypothetical protein